MYLSMLNKNRDDKLFLTINVYSVLNVLIVGVKRNLNSPNLVPPFLFSAKTYLIPLTPYHWQPCVAKFCDIKKG